MNEEQVLAQVEGLLVQVTTAQDTAVLKRATKELSGTFYKSDICIPVLVHILQHSQIVAVRQLAAVEARKLVSRFWKEEFAPQIRSTLLQSTLEEPDPKTRHASARLVSAIGRIDIQDGKWPELSTFCQQASTSPRVTDREVGLYIIYTLFESDPDFFEKRMAEMLRLFSVTIQDPESREVRQTTLLSLGELSARIYDANKDLIKAFRQVLPHMTVVLKQAIEADHESDARDAFEVFENLLIVESSLVSKNLRDLLEFFVGICADTNIDPTYREMALSFLSTAIRFKRQRIQMLKLGGDLMVSMLRIATEPDDAEPGDDSPVRLAIVNIDILSQSLPPAHVLPPLLEQFPKLVSSQNECERRAALLALGAVMEGALDYMAEYIDQGLQHVFAALKDPSPMVVRAALVSLSQITEELPSEVVKYHSTMVPDVFNLLQSNHSEVMKAACGTLDAILEWIPQDAMVHYLPNLMKALLSIMHNSTDNDVKLIAAAAIGTAAHASKSSFEPYLQPSVETFLNMSDVNTFDNFDLRGTVTDTLGTIASAVGKDNFGPYIDISYNLAVQGMKSESSRLRESAFCFFAVMASVLKEGFNHVLPEIVPSILDTLKQEDIDFGDKVTEEQAKALLNGNGEELDLVDTDDDDESIELNVNSALQVEKEIAADSLGEIFTNTREAFLPYLEESTKQLLELSDTFYEGARKSSLSALWKFVSTLGEMQCNEPWQPGLPLKIPLPADVVTLTNAVRKKSIEVLKEECDRDVMAEIFRSISDALNLLGPGVLGEDGFELAAITLLVLERGHPCQREEDDEEEPPADDDEIAEIESVLLDAAVDVVVALARTLTSQFAPNIDPFYVRLIKSTKSKNVTERSMAIAGLGEITDSLKGGVAKHTEELFTTFIHAMDDSAEEARSNAIYGIGLLLESTPQDLSSHYPVVLNKLQVFFRDDAQQNAKDNAVGCVSRMIMRHPDAVPLEIVLPAILHTLPLKDYAENEPTYAMIMRLYQAHNPTMLALTAQLLPTLAKILTVEDNQVKVTTRLSLLQLVKALRVEFPQLFESYNGLGMAH